MASVGECCKSSSCGHLWTDWCFDPEVNDPQRRRNPVTTVCRTGAVIVISLFMHCKPIIRKLLILHSTQIVVFRIWFFESDAMPWCLWQWSFDTNTWRLTKKPCVKRLGESTESNGDEPFFAIAKPFEFFTKHSHICQCLRCGNCHTVGDQDRSQCMLFVGLDIMCGHAQWRLMCTSTKVQNSEYQNSFFHRTKYLLM